MKRIESIKNPQVKQWKKLHTKKERELTQSFFVEGFHLVEEALKNKDQLLELIVSETVDIPRSWNMDNVRTTIVTNEVMKEISDTETTQGIAAICKQYNNTDIQLSNAKVLLIDSVQDPGNLGTMIRTADAAGITAIIVGEGSVDVYNPKVVRSTQGAIFHIPILKGVLTNWIEELKLHNVPIYGTSLQDAIHYKEIGPSESFALLVGNEGSGVSDYLLHQTNKNLYVPIKGKSESLNVAVATGILLYHLTE